MACNFCPPENMDPVSWRSGDPNNDGLIFPFSCITNPSPYGLTNFNIGLSVNERNQVIGTLGTIRGEVFFTATYDEQGRISTVTGSGMGLSVGSFPLENTYIISYTANMNTVSYIISFGPGSNTSAGTITGRICITDDVSMPLPPSDGLTGFVHLSPDGQVICQLNYTITTQNKSCKGPRSVSETYTKYYPDLRIEKVLKGCGCTLAQKVDSLNNSNVTTNRVAEYSGLRLILSSILFGDFDIKYLRRRYYEEFLEKLQNSSYSSYYDYFTVGTFYNYWRYFKK